MLLTLTTQLVDNQTDLRIQQLTRLETQQTILKIMLSTQFKILLVVFGIAQLKPSMTSETKLQ